MDVKHRHGERGFPNRASLTYTKQGFVLRRFGEGETKHTVEFDAGESKAAFALSLLGTLTPMELAAYALPKLRQLAKVAAVAEEDVTSAVEAIREAAGIVQQTETPVEEARRRV